MSSHDYSYLSVVALSIWLYRSPNIFYQTCRQMLAAAAITTITTNNELLLFPNYAHLTVIVLIISLDHDKIPLHSCFYRRN